MNQQARREDRSCDHTPAHSPDRRRAERRKDKTVSVKPTYVCDVCGATRKVANHWFLAWSMPNGCLMLASWDVPQSPGYHDQPDMKHLCGQVCVHSIVGKWMEQSTKHPILDTEQPLPATEGAQVEESITDAQAGGNDAPEEGM